MIIKKFIIYIIFSCFVILNLQGEHLSSKDIVFNSTINTNKAICQVVEDDQKKGYAVFVSSKGHILAKYSHLTDSCLIRFNNKEYPYTLVAFDKKNDLALLKIAFNTFSFIKFFPITMQVGDIVVTQSKVKVGVVSCATFFSRINLGINFVIGKGLKIAEVKQESPFLNILKKGDVLVKFDGIRLGSIYQFKTLFAKKKLGDKVKIEILKDKKKFIYDIILEFKSHINNFALQRHSFDEVIQHDIFLYKDELGSVLYNTKGHAIGFNIARLNRAEHYALPAKIINAFLQKYIRINSSTNSNVDYKLDAISSKLKKLYIKSQRSVVGVQMGNSSGSGVIVSSTGYVLTASHVLGKNNQVKITLFDGTKVDAVVYSRDKYNDLAILKITKIAKYTYASFKKKDTKVGDLCYSIAHLGGYQNRRGSVLRIGKVLTSMGNRLWTSCTLLPGDSGGPLFDFDGNLIGINSSISFNHTTNLHCTIDIFLNARKTFRDVKDITYSSLNIMAEEDNNQLKVLYIEDNSYTRDVLKQGDIILEFNNKKITSRQDIKNVLKTLKYKDKVNIKYLRNNKSYTKKIIIDKKKLTL